MENGLMTQCHSLPLIPKSRDAIASKNQILMIPKSDWSYVGWMHFSDIIQFLFGETIK